MTSLLLATLLAAPPALADGASTFASYCSTCHGPAGKGDGPASAALEPKPANFSASDFWTTRTDAGVKQVIKAGGAASGKSPVMPEWGAVLTDAQIDEVVAHIRTLQQ